MSESFNPYYTWLGIPPSDQPPNHYRLLGLERFEENPDVISHAADQRMAHLRTFQSGKHQDAAQRLLNETAQARIVLLDAARKADYDAQLRSTLAAQAAPVSPAISRGDVPPASLRQRRRAGGVSRPSNASGGLTPPARPGVAETNESAGMPKSALLGGGAAVLIIAAVVVAMLAGGPADDRAARAPSRVEDGTGGDDATTTAPDDTEGASAAEKRADDNDDTGAAEERGSAGNGDAHPSNENGSGGADVDPPPATEKDPTDEAVDPPSVVPVGTSATKQNPKTPTAGEEQPATSEPEPIAMTKPEDKPPAKPPVPDKAARMKSLQLVNEVFGDELKGATTRDEKSALAEMLLKHANQTADDPTARYVLFDLAWQQAVEAGSADLAIQAVEGIADRHEVDALRLKASALYESGRATMPAEDHRAVIDAGLTLMNESAAADRFDIALPLEQVLLRSASRVRDGELFKSIRAQVAAVKEMAKLYESVAAARATLAETADDPAANTAVGKYLCLVKGRWQEGLEHLARGDDVALAAAAIADLAKPTDAEAQLTLADQWYDYAASDAGEDAFYAQADHWYRQVVGDLTGLAKAKVEKRLEETEAYARSAPRENGLSGSGSALPAIPADAIVTLNPEKLKEITSPANVPFSRVAVSPRGDGAVAADRAGNLLFFADLETWDVERTEKAHTAIVWALTYSHDGSKIASGGDDAVVNIWDARTGRNLQRIAAGKKVRQLAFDGRDRHLLAVLEGDGVGAWEVRSGRPVGWQQAGAVRSVAVAPSGLVAFGSTQGDIGLLDAQLKPSSLLKGHQAPVVAVKFSADGKRLASLGDREGVKTWNMAGKLVSEFKSTIGLDIALSPDGRWIALTDMGREGYIFDGLTGKLVAQRTIGSTGFDVAFLPDGRRLVYAADQVQVWAMQPTIEPPTVFNGGVTAEDLQKKPLHVAAVIYLKDRNGPTAADRVLFSNGKVIEPDGKHEWKIEGNAFNVGDPGSGGGFTIAPDGRTMSGRMWRGARVHGRVVYPPSGAVVPEIHSIWSVRTSEKKGWIVTLLDDGRVLHRDGEGKWSQQRGGLRIDLPDGTATFKMAPGGDKLAGSRDAVQYAATLVHKGS